MSGASQPPGPGGPADPAAGGAAAAGPGGQPSEDEMRAAMEEQLRTVTVQDLLLDSIVGIVNLTARRILKEDERDLDQARVGIDAVRGIVDLLEPEQAEGVRRALSELQMHYVQAAGGAPAGATGEQPAGAQQPPPAQPQPGAQQRPQQPSRPGEPPPRLWTPGRGN